jgi:acetyltransferase-like isoleucine patch superfamily enzyme
LIIVGCGGMSKDILSFIDHEEVFFYDDFKVGEFEGYGIWGTTDDLCKTPIYNEIFLGIGSIGDNRVRNRIYEKLTRAGLKVSPLIFPSKICYGVKLGENIVIGLNSQIHHDCVIEDNVVISPGVILCGNVTLEQNVFVGAGAVIIQGITVGENAVIGAGSVVLKDVPPNAVMAGNPSRFIKWNT